MRLQAKWFLETGGCRVGNYVISQLVCVSAFIPWPMGMRVSGNWEIAQFRTPLFFTCVDASYVVKWGRKHTSHYRVYQMNVTLGWEMPRVHMCNFYSTSSLEIRSRTETAVHWESGKVILFIKHQAKNSQHVSCTFESTSSEDAWTWRSISQNRSCGLKRFLSHNDPLHHLQHDTLTVKEVVCNWQHCSQ